MQTPSPIFMISLPRSGSTLLQRILTVNPQIHSVSEPWLLLPFGFFLEQKGVHARYSHATFFYAMEDFLKVLENGKKDFHEAVRRYATYLYSQTKGSGDARYFLDKTPRYYLIIDFLAEAFPEAKFIFLFRNPVEVFASILTTWYGGDFSFYQNYVDVYEGPACLARGYEKLGSRAMGIQYDQLITDPAGTTAAICHYLGLDYTPAMVESYRCVPLTGRMGDPKEAKEYASVSTAPRDKWKTVLNTHYRRWFLRGYVRFLGDEVLQAFSLSVGELLREIDSIRDLRPGSFTDMKKHAEVLKRIVLGDEHFGKALRAIIKNKPYVPLR